MGWAAAGALLFLVGAAASIPFAVPPVPGAAVLPFGAGAAAAQSSTTPSSLTLSTVTGSSLTTSSLTLSSLTLSSDTDTAPEPAPRPSPPPGFKGHGFSDFPEFSDEVWHRVGDPELAALLHDIRGEATDGVILYRIQELLDGGYLADDWLKDRMDFQDAWIYDIYTEIWCHRHGVLLIGLNDRPRG